MGGLSYYDALGITRNATTKDIKTAYKKQCLALHPDKNQYGQAMMKFVNEAYATLSDEVTREIYDMDILTEAEVRAKLVESEKKQRNLRAKIATLEGNIHDMGEKAVISESLLSEKNAQNKELQHKQKRIEKEVTFLMSKKDSLEQENKDQKRQIGVYESKMERTARALREERRKSVDDFMQSTDFADKVADYQSAIATLEESARQQHQESLELKQSLSSFQAQVNDLSGHVSTLKTGRAELARNNEKLDAYTKHTLQTFQKKYSDLSGLVSTLTTERDKLVTKSEEASSELSKLQSTFDLLVEERDAAEKRVRELLTGGKAGEEVVAALNSEKELLIAKIEECIAQLYSEKDDPPRNRDDDYLGFDLNGESLEKQLQAKSAKAKRLSREKEKLEAYTKHTLQIFQQKYLDTTQNYKTQLKGMTQKIQALESELANQTNSEKEVLVAKIEECIAQLYPEKDDPPRNRDDDYLGFESLEKQLQAKSAEVKRLSREKEKLEAYTKHTLQMFQQTYFDTTQSYKTQLKGMTQKVQVLESDLEWWMELCTAPVQTKPIYQ